jgi:hypothetical protein
MSFGIPPSAIPMQHCSDGALQLKNHLRFIQQRQKREHWLRRRPTCTNTFSGDGASAASLYDGGIVVSSSVDVLFGRGIVKQRNVGNTHLNDLYEEHTVSYSQARKLEKKKIAMEIVHALKKKNGARFLAKEEDDWTWAQVDDKTAATKICQGFRNRKQTLLLNNNNDKSSSTARHLSEKRRMVSSSSAGSTSSSITTHSISMMTSSSSDMILEKNDSINKRPRTL